MPESLVDPSELLSAIMDSLQWRPFIGILGFSKGGWEVAGVVTVPKDLMVWPLFQGVINEGPLERDPLTFRAIRQVRTPKGREIVQEETAGHLYVPGFIEVCLREGRVPV
jgi:hypothetical protein